MQAYLSMAIEQEKSVILRPLFSFTVTCHLLQRVGRVCWNMYTHDVSTDAADNNYGVYNVCNYLTLLCNYCTYNDCYNYI